MKFTGDFFEGAQKLLMELFTKSRPELMKLHGRVEHELKADKSVVTHLDKELELKIKEVLSQYDPGVGFWGEEFGKEGSQKSYWLVDPIDGTESLIRGLNGCRNIVTFIDNEIPLYTLAYRFTTDDLFTAQKNQPTLKNGHRVKLSDRPLERSWLELSVNMEQPEGYEIYKNLHSKTAVTNMHQDFLEILEGAIEGIVVYKGDGHEWDYAPRALFIESAGGRVANIGSEDYDFNNLNLIATTTQIFDGVKESVEGSLN